MEGSALPSSVSSQESAGGGLHLALTEFVDWTTIGGSITAPSSSTLVQIEQQIEYVTCELTCLQDTLSPDKGLEMHPVVLRPPTAMLALKAINAAAGMCIERRQSALVPCTDGDKALVVSAAVDFLKNAFGCLEYDLVFAALRVPVAIRPDRRANNGGNVAEDTTFTTVVDILFSIILSEDPQSREEDGSFLPWNRSTVRSDAFVALSRALRAAEFVQRYASSLTSLPTSGIDSALGRGMGIGLEGRGDVLETISHYAVDFLLQSGEGAGSVTLDDVSSEFPDGVSAMSDTIQSGHQGREDTAEQKGLYAACASLLSTLLRVDVTDWMYPAKSKHPRRESYEEECDSASQGEEHNGSRTQQLCRVLLLQTHLLKDDNLTTPDYQCIMVSLSLISLIQWKYRAAIDVIEDRGLFNSYFDLYVLGVVLTVDADDNSTDHINNIGPRWIHHPNEAIKRSALRVVSDVSLIRGDAASVIKSSPILGPFLEYCWKTVVENHERSQQHQSLKEKSLFRVEYAINCILTLKLNCRAKVRRALNALLPPEVGSDIRDREKEANETYSRLVQSLFSLCQHEHFAIAASSAAILKSFLEDKPRGLCNDELSRNLWEALEDSRFCVDALNRLLPYTLQLSSADDMTSECSGSVNSKEPSTSFSAKNKYYTDLRWEPRLCSIIDVLGLMSASEVFCRNMLQGVLLDFKAVDNLQEIMLRDHSQGNPVATKARHDGINCVSFASFQTGRTAHSLSRRGNMLHIDHFSDSYYHSKLDAFFGFSTETTPIGGAISDGVSFDTRPSPLECAIKLGAAMLLARLGHVKCDANVDVHADYPEDTQLQSQVQVSARRALRSFITNSAVSAGAWVAATTEAKPGCILEFSTTQGYSRDLTRRATRLYSFLAASSGENEQWMASSIFTASEARSTAYSALSERMGSCQLQLEKMTAKADELSLENDHLHEKLESQRIVCERELTRARNQARADAMDLVEVHAEERATAEKQVQLYNEALFAAEKNRKEAEAQVERANASEEQTRTELASSVRRKYELEELLEQEQAKVKQQESKNEQAARDLCSVRDEMQEISNKQRDAETKLSETEEELAKAVEAKKELNSNLEYAFSKLVGLAQLLELKQKEISGLKERYSGAVNDAMSVASTAKQKYSAARRSEKHLIKENKELRRKLAVSKNGDFEEKESTLHLANGAGDQRAQGGLISYINQLHDDPRLKPKKSGRKSKKKKKSDEVIEDKDDEEKGEC